MAVKDIAEKILEDYPDVFADIVNGFLFSGKKVIKPDELEDTQLRYHESKAKGGLRNMCNVIDEYLAKGEKRGREKGKKIGEAEANERVAIDMLKDNEPIAKIKKYSKLPEAAICKLAKSLGVAVVL